MADERNKSVSFTFAKKKTNKTLQNTGSSVLGTDHGLRNEGEEKDFITSAEGKDLKSVRPKEEAKELVIPLQKKNRWILPTTADGLDRQAAEELVKDALKDLEGRDDQDEDLSIPMLLRNKVPAVEGYEQDEKLDIAMRPDESSQEDYEAVPVSAFGVAMLRGMGWKKGECIGGTVKGICEPIEYIPRSKGLGLGAEKKNEPSKRKRKPGDEEKKMTGPIKEKDGRVRHVKGVGEKVAVGEELQYQPGTGAVIEKGPHTDMHGKIISVDVDNSRVTVRLHLSGENVTIHQFHVRLIDSEEYRELCKPVKSKDKRKESRDSGPSSNKRKKDDKPDHSKRKDDKHKDKTHKSSSSTSNGNSSKRQEESWLYPEMRVRIISRELKKGRFYNSKVRIVDVTGRSSCTCETQDGKLLEGVLQSMLETVVPKSENAYVRIVRGSNKGQLGTILQRDSSKCKAVVQFLLDKNVVTLDYDDISEHLGDIREDFL
ncbi:G-patch domain and KOW motifs-containing protein-like [Actinia tenebrosa]|uniref:G-patch domain and KOW motifs-containing protein-like n=1 Tax=Actinia tenebrosa TaxID=6105 RepID=A0A6P8IXB9_ACTTE|nr:G-patch domain and KOW motifs-containing protein-like [Actinia tenebrosa]